jgi:acetyl-CoA carboxylase biotin carboxyl carrier protein
MDLEQVKKFIELVKDTDIEELYWEKEGTKIAFKRGTVISGEEKVTPSETAGEKPPVLSSGENKKKEEKVLPIKSPMVGTFYRSLPDRPPLVMENDHVSVGEKVAVIEAMRIIKDVVANVNGRIVKILVENATPVEYGQDLFLVETETLMETDKKNNV